MKFDFTKYCKECGKEIELRIKRDIIRKNFCSRICNGIYSGKKKFENIDFKNKMISLANTPESNAKKGHSGQNHHLWIEDRTKLKQKRCVYEEKEFFKQILKERNYICQVTGKVSRNLSVHHIDSVHLYPEKKFDKDNVVVILKEIHIDFHKKYGFQWATKCKWQDYLLNYEKEIKTKYAD
jgi:hypothetical protein